MRNWMGFFKKKRFQNDISMKKTKFLKVFLDFQKYHLSALEKSSSIHNSLIL